MSLTPLVRLARSLGTVFVVCMASWSCDILGSTDESSCGPAGEPLVINLDDAVQALTSPRLETSLFQGRRNYEWTWLVENACAEEHVRAAWDLIVDDAQLPAGWLVSAGYELGVLFSRDITLVPTQSAANRRSYHAETSIGLSQLYEGKPARFLIWVGISFTSLGDPADDRAAAQRLLKFVALSANWKQYKAS
jgi:hypothetical protein